MVNFRLYFRIYLWRLLVRLNSFLDLRMSALPPRRPSSKIYMRLKSGSQIPLVMYTPQGQTKSVNSPVVINFHGGGFMMGTPEEDGRWAESLTRLGAYVVSVGYRLCPEYPHPTGIDDCTEAVQWVWKNASQLGINSHKTILSGFSAGGVLALIVSARVMEETTEREGTITGIVSVYPGVDRSLSRIEKRASNTKSVEMASLNVLFDEAYGLHALDTSSPEVSPAKASDKDIKNRLPHQIALFTAELDPLLVETENYRSRLAALGKKVYGDTMNGKGHYWDKKPSYRRLDHDREDWLQKASNIAKMMWSGE